MDTLTESVQAVLDEQIRPRLLMHGGDLELLTVQASGTIRLRFLGACEGCLLRPVTLVGCIVPALAQVGAIVNIEVEGMAVPDAARKRLKRQSALESLGR
ncbi:MAG TPA: NifU family protein [Anaerolineae bacterium]|nr:NifU family protein [Anaerolineae bacterium]